MQEEKDENRELDAEKKEDEAGEEVVERPAPGIEHHREPDAENIMPAKDQPGTF